MAAMNDSPVIRELAAIMQGIGHFPNPNDLDFTTCRGFEKDYTNRCKIPACSSEEQSQLDTLFFQFQIMTTCVDSSDLYDKMQDFITLTHCRNHLDNAYDAFDRWKAQRKATISSPRPITPSRSATVYYDCLESISDISSMQFHNSTSDNSEDELARDFHLAEEMKSLKIATAVQDAREKTGDNDLNKAEAKSEAFERLGTVKLPKEGQGHDDKYIRQVISKGLHADRRSMNAGIVYVLKHTKIPNLFKVGVSSDSAMSRHSSNCFKSETDVIYGLESEKFDGATHAESIAHAILRHKKLKFEKCLYCPRKHREWFVTSRQEVLSAVMLAEQWMKMPAYVLQPEYKAYKLTPDAEIMCKEMFPFSISTMDKLINKVKQSDNASSTFPNTPLAATVGETKSPSSSPIDSGRTKPRIVVDKSPDTTPSRRSNPRGRSPVGGVGSKSEGSLLEIEEVFEVRRRRSISKTSDRIEVVEAVKIVRKKVSRTKLPQDSGIFVGCEPIAFDLKGEK